MFSFKFVRPFDFPLFHCYDRLYNSLPLSQSMTLLASLPNWEHWNPRMFIHYPTIFRIFILICYSFYISMIDCFIFAVSYVVICFLCTEFYTQNPHGNIAEFHNTFCIHFSYNLYKLFQEHMNHYIHNLFMINKKYIE